MDTDPEVKLQGLKIEVQANLVKPLFKNSELTREPQFYNR